MTPRTTEASSFAWSIRRARWSTQLAVDSDAAHTADYILDVTLNPGSCGDDTYEPNETTSNATPLSSEALSLRGCPGNADRFMVDGDVGELLEVVVQHQPRTAAVHLTWRGSTVQTVDGSGELLVVPAGTPQLVDVVPPSTDAVSYTAKVRTWSPCAADPGDEGDT